MPKSEEKRTYFVNREGELQKFHELYNWVVNHKEIRIVLLRGDYGVGKTALVEYFLGQREKQNDEIFVGRGKCCMETEGSGLTPFGELYTSLVEQGIHWKIIGESVWEFTKKVAPAWLDIATVGMASAAVNALDESSKALKSGHSKFTQENVFVQYTNALESLTKKHPTIAFIDDLQWADSSSLRLLFHLANHLKALPILFILTYRPVEAMEFGSNAELFREIRANLLRLGAVEIEIMKGIDANSYINQRYSPNNFPSELSSQVQKQTGGHALFVTQLFSWWEETGIIQTVLTSEGSPLWTLTQDVPNFSKIPPTLGAILDERIRLMGKRLQNILTRASIEGEDFSAQVIINLLELDELQAFEDIETLERSYQLVQEQETRQIGNAVFDMYRFMHRFFREHIYGQLNKGLRRNLHQQVGECLEQIYSEKEVIAGQLTRHFREAGQYQKAANYALMAAKYEQSRYSWDEGETWCALGLSSIELIANDGEVDALKLALIEQSGEGYYYAGDYDNAYLRYKKAFDLAIQYSARVEHIVNICFCLTDISDEKGASSEGMHYIEQAKDLLAKQILPGSELQIALKGREGLLYTRLGQIERAIKIFRQALESAQEMEATPSLLKTLVDVYNDFAITLGYQNNYNESTLMYKKAIDIASKIDYQSMTANSLSNLADDYTLSGEWDEAEATVSKAITIARQIGDYATEGWALSVRGELRLSREKYLEAIRTFEEAIRLIKKSGSIWGLSYSYADMAMAHLALSNVDIAYQNALESKDFAANDYRRLAYSMDVLGRVEGNRQNYAQAIEHFEKSLTLREGTTDRHLRARTQRHYAETLFLVGDRDKAMSIIRISLETFKDLKLQYEIAETQSVLDKYN